MTLRTLSAAWLVLLILSPFTTPFSTCELQDLDGGLHHSPPSPHRTALARESAMASPVHAFAVRTGRIRDQLASPQLLDSILLSQDSGDHRAARSINRLRLRSIQPANLRI